MVTTGARSRGRHRVVPPPWWEDTYHVTVRATVDLFLGFVMLIVGAFAPVRPAREDSHAS